MKNKYNLFATLLLFTLFVSFLLLKINIDFWNDELYTLKHFVFVPISTTLTDYHVPNNHIFFNLINNLYLKIIGVNSFDELLDQPFLLRILPLIYSIICAFFVYKIGELLFSKLTGQLTIIVLITTITFFTHTLQIRGYGLSMTLLSAIIYFCFLYLKKKHVKTLAGIFIATLLFLYTIPSNLFFLMGIYVYFGSLWLFHFIKLREWKTPTFYLLVAISFGIFITLLLYLPFFSQVTSNEYVNSFQPYNNELILYYLSCLWEGVNSNRWLITIPSIFGLATLFIKKNTSRNDVVLLILIVSIPFIFIWFHGDKPPGRIFTPTIPIYALLIAIGLSEVIKFFKPTQKTTLVFLTSITFYCSIIFILELNNIKKRLQYDLKVGYRSQELYYQYYSNCYEPLKQISDLSNLYSRNPLPILTFGCEDHGVPNYLKKFNLPFTLSDNIDSMTQITDSFYVVTNHLSKLSLSSDYLIDTLSKELTYHNILLYRKDNQLLEKSVKIVDSLLNNSKTSTGFIFDSNNESLKHALSKYNEVIFYNPSDKASVIALVEKKENLYYFCEENKTDDFVFQLMFDQHTLKEKKNYHSKQYQYCFEKNRNSERKNTQVFLDFETSNQQKPFHLYHRNGYKSIFGETLDPEHLYSTDIHISRDKFDKDMCISFYSDIKPKEDAIVVIEIKNKDKNLWFGINLKDYNYQNEGWKKFFIHFAFPFETKVTDEVVIYLWNHEQKSFTLDNLKIITPKSF